MNEHDDTPLTGKEKRLAALAANRSKTQFGGVNAPIHSSQTDVKPWSVRNSIRHIAKQTVDISDKDSVSKCLPEKPTISQLIALNVLIKATKADMRAVEYVTDQIDGKLVQPNLNADLAAVQAMSEEELDAAIAQLQRELDEEAADHDAASGEEEEEGAGPIDGAADSGNQQA